MQALFPTQSYLAFFEVQDRQGLLLDRHARENAVLNIVMTFDPSD